MKQYSRYQNKYREESEAPLFDEEKFFSDKELFEVEDLKPHRKWYPTDVKDSRHNTWEDEEFDKSKPRWKEEDFEPKKPFFKEEDFEPKKTFFKDEESETKPKPCYPEDKKETKPYLSWKENECEQDKKR
jgi:hypothetical protein